MNRVVFAIPYTSICEQTTSVYESIFGEGAVLEHHSAVDISDPDSPATETAVWGRLAAQNWDAPIIVTTTVQLFESLLAASTSKCRKLHNLARSVIILDEAQTIPTHLLNPVLDVLGELTRAYGTTVVFCTATQPELRDAFDSLSLGQMPEIVPQYKAHFQQLKRVTYRREPEPWDWPKVGEEMAKSNQALAILNARRSAQDVARECLNHGLAVHHLSTQMCGQHRRDVLNTVRQLLADHSACHLVATQVVEAGVDLDFPLVLRAFGPLDRIVQAAGRCNRNGSMKELGEVIVFEPADSTLPPGPYQTATSITEGLWEAGVDPDDPDLFPRFFRSYFKRINRDKRQLQDLREQWLFARVARDAHVIDDKGGSVLVPYGEFKTALAALQSPDVPPRLAWRLTQPFLVSLHRHEMDKARAAGLLGTIREGTEVYLWKGDYDRVLGLTWEGHQEFSGVD